MLSQDELERVERVCRERIAKATALGVRVGPNGPLLMMPGYKETCLLGAICGPWTEFIPDYREKAAGIIGLSKDDAYSIEAGFEGWRETPTNDALYVIGQKLRAECLGVRS